MDEVDALLNSMTSECNYPIGHKKNLEPRPERWELPMALLDVLCRATDAAAGRLGTAPGQASSGSGSPEHVD